MWEEEAKAMIFSVEIEFTFNLWPSSTSTKFGFVDYCEWFLFLKYSQILAVGRSHTHMECGITEENLKNANVLFRLARSQRLSIWALLVSQNQSNTDRFHGVANQICLNY